MACVLSLPSIAFAGLYLEIIDGELVCGDGQVIMLNASDAGLGNIVSGQVLGTGTAFDALHVIPIDLNAQPGISSGAIYPFFPTIDSYTNFSAWPATIELLPIVSVPEIYNNDPVLQGLDGVIPSESLYVVYVPEPACLALFGIGGLIVSSRRNKKS